MHRETVNPSRGVDTMRERRTLHRSWLSLLLCQVVIKVRTIFLKVGEIDTMKDRFAADVFVQAKWREPMLDHKLEMVSVPERLHYSNFSTAYTDNIAASRCHTA